MTERVWGYVNDGDTTIAAYFVEWTPGHAATSANFDLILGKWGQTAGSKERKAVALDFRRLDTGPAFRVIDAADRPVAKSDLVGEALKREQVVGQPIAEKVFAICDVVWLRDHRLAPLRDLFSDATS